jgi:hypothetical protein
MDFRGGSHDWRASSYLKTLAEQAHKPIPKINNLTKADASERIDELRLQAGLKDADARSQRTRSRAPREAHRTGRQWAAARDYREGEGEAGRAAAKAQGPDSSMDNPHRMRGGSAALCYLTYVNALVR